MITCRSSSSVIRQSLSIRRRPSESVRCLPSHLNDFSSKTSGPISFKLHVKTYVKGGLKIYTNGHGLLIKMAAMPIYSKILKNILLQNQESLGAWCKASRTRSTRLVVICLCPWALYMYKIVSFLFFFSSLKLLEQFSPDCTGVVWGGGGGGRGGGFNQKGIDNLFE